MTEALYNHNWSVYRLEDTFECTKGVYLPTETVKAGDIPFITAKAGNNGLSSLISNGTLFDGGRITIEKIRLSAYYQPAPFYCSHDVSVISNEKITEDNAQFIACMIMRNGIKYSYGRQAQLNVVKREQIIMPSIDEGEPDWDYMSSYVQSIKENLIERYKRFVQKRISELEYKEIPSLSELEWEAYNISVVFNEIGRGKRLKKADQIQGDTPYVSSTSMNNGVDGFITATAGTRVFCDCISLANSGSVGSAFYEPFEFVASDHVTHLKNEAFDKWTYLFLTTIIEKQGVNFNFNREINDTRIKRMKIMLPVNGTGEPDFDYMRQYAKNMMLRKYEQYLEYLEKKA